MTTLPLTLPHPEQPSSVAGGIGSRRLHRRRRIWPRARGEAVVVGRGGARARGGRGSASCMVWRQFQGAGVTAALVVRTPGSGGARPQVSSGAWAQVPAAPARPLFFPFEQGSGAPASVLVAMGGARRCSESHVAAILLSAYRLAGSTGSSP